MKVILKDINKNLEQSMLDVEIGSVTEFLLNISNGLERLEEDTYYCIYFKYKNKYNKIITAKLGYIYMDTIGNNKTVAASDEIYLVYYIEKLNLNEVVVEYKKNIGNINIIKVIYNIPHTRATDELPQEGNLILLPEDIVSSDFRFNMINYKFFELKMIKYINLENLECILNIKDENINMPISELVKLYNIDVSKNINFYWNIIK